MAWSNRNAYYQALYDHFEEYGSYYRLVKQYTDELAYSRKIKVDKSYIGWVNNFHHA